METKENILQILRDIKSELTGMYNVRSLALFGSYSRGDQTEQSDVDILVEFERPISGLTFVGLAETIERHLNKQVDIVPADGIKPRYMNFIRKDLVYV